LRLSVSRPAEESCSDRTQAPAFLENYFHRREAHLRNEERLLAEVMTVYIGLQVLHGGPQIYDVDPSQSDVLSVSFKAIRGWLARGGW